jgi:hypothetical protein
MGELDSQELVPVFDARNEFEALSVRSYLEEEGVEAAIRDLQIPMMDGIAMVKNPVWGQVLVLEKDVARARDLVAAYLDDIAALEGGGDYYEDMDGDGEVDGDDGYDYEDEDGDYD